MLNKIEKSMLAFLIDGKAYSDGAIMKNLGINEIELDEVYKNLLKEGYLESYEDFLRKNPEYNSSCEDKKESSCSSGCGGCSSGGCGGCSSKDEDMDYSKIKVLTEKAFIYNY